MESPRAPTLSDPPDRDLAGTVALRHDALAARVFGTAVGWGVFATLCVAGSAALIPFSLRPERGRPRARERFSDLTRLSLRLYVRMLPFLRLEVDRRERRCAGPCVVVANHQSWLDPILMISLEKRLSGPARGYLFRTPALRSILDWTGFYEAEAGAPAPLERMRRCVDEVLARGGSLLFFPEGMRSRDGEVRPFQRGAFRLAVDYGLPIQPVVIEGLDRVLPPGSLLAKKGNRYPVRVRYLEPIGPPFAPGPRRSVVRALAARAHAEMATELARMRGERPAGA